MIGGILGGAWGLIALWLTRDAPWYVTVATILLGAVMCGLLASKLTR